jgi:hypothetical protein
MRRPPRPDHDVADCLRRLAEHKQALEETPLFPTPPPPEPKRPTGPWDLLRDLRQAQNRYFRTATPEDLSAARDLEIFADRCIRDHFAGRTLPFGD